MKELDLIKTLDETIFLFEYFADVTCLCFTVLKKVTYGRQPKTNWMCNYHNDDADCM